ncbi:MAG TPA: hypothetical protein VD884_16800 [Ohtaekwangia sp.]|nr:hypothetical protein [Ohtaekwangia sp.]
MKTFITFVFTLIILTSCDVYVVEPRVDHREAIVGYYDMEEYSETYHEYVYYDFIISKSRYSSREIYLDNFYASDLRVYAYVDNNYITIPFQIVSGYEIEGHGTFRRNELELYYTVSDIYHHTATDICDSYAVRIHR